MSRHIPFERLHNFRDLGGYPTADGQVVRWGRLFRADSLGKLTGTGADWDRFLGLGVTAVIDLRYPWEIEAKGRVPEHPALAYHNLSIEHRAYDQPSLAPEVEIGPYLSGKYMEVAEDGVKELRQALDVIAAPDAGPVVFHCASGKDRTGQLASLVLALLGVPDEVIVEDFTLTELATERLLADWSADRGGASPRWPAYCHAPAEVMRLFLAAMAERYGSVQAYAAEQLGVDAELVAALRRNLLEPALAFRRAGEADLPVLVGLRDAAANWQLARGIDQWQPGELGEDHFRARLADGEVWIATLGPGGAVAGAWELWWQDPAAWGSRPGAAGYVHRLMTDRGTAPPGTGRRMLAEAERRIAEAGLDLCRLDCLADNARLRAYYQAAGYRVVGEQPAKSGARQGTYAVTLLEKRLSE